MMPRFLSGSLLVLALVLLLAACTGQGPVTGTVVATPASIMASPWPTAVHPTFTPPTPMPAPSHTRPLTATPTPIPSHTTPTSIPPSSTSTPIPPSSTPTRTPRPTEQERPTATFTLTTMPLNDLRVELQRVSTGLDTPAGIANAGDGSGRLFVLEQVGRIRVIQNGASPPLLDILFLDITDRVGSAKNEQGLLGLAFHPDYADNGLFFVNYTNRQGDTVVSRFAVSDDPGRADPASEVVLLTLAQPAANHNGGHLAFGPDGYLYIGTGDGGAAGDKFDNGQNGQTLLGAMLRLDVDHGQPYAVPSSNPFVNDRNVRNEIWAIGLRNPWRYSFDRLTGDLYIADVGQNLYEEVNVQPAASPGGQNYGWPIMEGLHCFPADQPCDRTGLTLPVREYDHTQGCSVTGGYVYRGQEFPMLNGVYLFGDFCSGRIWGLAPTLDGDWQVARLAQVDVQLSSFGEDEAGELYLCDMGHGELFKITARHR